MELGLISLPLSSCPPFLLDDGSGSGRWSSSPDCRSLTRRDTHVPLLVFHLANRSLTALGLIPHLDAYLYLHHGAVVSPLSGASNSIGSHHNGSIALRSLGVR